MVHELRSIRLTDCLFLIVDVGRAAQCEIDHPSGDRFIRIAINEDKGTSVTIVGVKSNATGLANETLHTPTSLRVNVLAASFAKSCHINLMLQLGDSRPECVVIDLH